jgi:hypothetical protein
MRVYAAPVRPALLAVLVVLACCTAASTARAQDFVGARAISLGEAYRATATGNDAIYFNPAGLVVIPRYSPETHYQFDLVQEQHVIDISVVDSKTSPMAAGLAYTFNGELTTRTSLQHTATLALAAPVADKYLSVGAGLKYVNVSDAFLGNYLNALSADLGLLSRPFGGLSFAAVGYNLIPIQSARVPLSAGFATALDLGPLSALIFGGSPSFGAMPNAAGTASSSTMGDLVGPLSGWTWEVDWHLAFATLYGTQSRWSVGTEYLLLEMVPLRAGYQYEERAFGTGEDDDHLVSVGAGFIIPFFGFDIAYQQSVIRADRAQFAMSLKFFLNL